MSNDKPTPHHEERMNTAVVTTPVDDAWNDLATLETTRDAIDLIDKATYDERVRCREILAVEISKGENAGIPKTSGVMVLLTRIASAIGNG